MRAISASGYDARWVSAGLDGVQAVQTRRPDLVLLDLGLPDIDGLEVCRRIHRFDSSIDVIMLTARDDELDIVVGLDAGAVDYITKPFKLAELMARVRAQLRRVEARAQPIVDAGDLMLDTASRRVWLDGGEIDLRAKEFDLLSRLAADAGHVVTRETLMADVWDEHWFGSTKTLDFHVAALRRKLDQAGSPGRISTVRSSATS